MPSYVLLNKAVSDLSAIWDYTAETWSERQADKYYFMLLDFCQDIADGKVKGRNYPEIGAEIFGLRAGEHILFYRKIRADRVEIIRILHNRMDLRNRMQG